MICCDVCILNTSPTHTPRCPPCNKAEVRRQFAATEGVFGTRAGGKSKIIFLLSRLRWAIILFTDLRSWIMRAHKIFCAYDQEPPTSLNRSLDYLRKQKHKNIRHTCHGWAGSSIGSAPAPVSQAPWVFPKECPPPIRATVSVSFMPMRLKTSRMSSTLFSGSGTPSTPSALT